jgi:Family of unknown function (DUF6210)
VDSKFDENHIVDDPELQKMLKKNLCRKVRLHELEQLALIVREESRVLYSNQAGGHYCLQPEAEGVLVVLSADYSLLERKAALLWERLSKVFGSASSYTTDEQAEAIDNLLSFYVVTRDMSVDRNHLKDSYEAWVYVNIQGELSGSIEGFGNCKGILTWPNSD